MPPPDEDYPLLRQIAQGDEKALATLMQRHKQALFRCVFRYVGNEADAAEITEEAFFKVYQKAGSFSPRGSVRSWVFTIGVNLARDHLRRRKRHAGAISMDADNSYEDGDDGSPLSRKLPARETDPAEDLLSAETVAHVETEIRALPEKLRFPFIYCVLEDHSYDDCADILRTSRKTVETRIYRARQRLRQRLAE